jgi:hypothetical protein
MLLSTLIFVSALNNYAQAMKASIEQFEFEEKALLIADSFVKNFDSNNTMLGACIYDSDKKRVKTNVLSSENISRATSISFGSIFTKSITYTSKSLDKTFLLKDTNSNECISAKRFVLIEGETAIIQILTCREG